MSYFKHHVFFCCNQRAEGETSCANHDAVALQTYAKERIGALGLNGKGQIRINKAGCLGRCDDAGRCRCLSPDAGDDAPGLGDDEPPGGVVPGVDAALVVAVEAAGRDGAQAGRAGQGGGGDGHVEWSWCVRWLREDELLEG